MSMWTALKDPGDVLFNLSCKTVEGVLSLGRDEDERGSYAVLTRRYSFVHIL